MIYSTIYLVIHRDASNYQWWRVIVCLLTEFLMKVIWELIASAIVHSAVYLIVQLTIHLTVHLIVHLAVFRVDFAEVDEVNGVNKVIWMIRWVIVCMMRWGVIRCTTVCWILTEIQMIKRISEIETMVIVFLKMRAMVFLLIVLELMILFVIIVVLLVMNNSSICG